MSAPPPSLPYATPTSVTAPMMTEEEDDEEEPPSLSCPRPPPPPHPLLPAVLPLTILTQRSPPLFL